jgi:hypothetical protein
MYITTRNKRSPYTKLIHITIVCKRLYFIIKKKEKNFKFFTKEKNIVNTLL